MLRLFRAHWRGDTPFWRALFGVSMLLPALVLIASAAVMGSDHFHESPPYQRMMIGIAITLAAAFIGVWQLVGTWRSSSRARAPERNSIVRFLARLLALPAAVGGLAMLAILPGSLQSLHEVATDRDPIARSGHRVVVAADRLNISGAVGWGMLDKVDRALAANPGIRTVSLDSLGGHTAAGRAIAGKIRSRGLDTVVMATCASACTFMFYSGKRRFLGRGGRIGFHADDSQSVASATAATKRSTAFWEKAGLPAAFVQRVSSTPPESVWWPTHEELRRLGIVTDLIR